MATPLKERIAILYSVTLRGWPTDYRFEDLHTDVDSVEKLAGLICNGDLELRSGDPCYRQVVHVLAVEVTTGVSHNVTRELAELLQRTIFEIYEDKFGCRELVEPIVNWIGDVLNQVWCPTSTYGDGRNDDLPFSHGRWVAFDPSTLVPVAAAA